MKITLFLVTLLISVASFSQDRQLFVYGHFSDKTVSLTPFYKVFGSHFDPAITGGAGVEYFSRGNSTLYQQLQGTWYTADMIGAGITLSTSLGYRYQLPVGLFAEAMLGVGGTAFISARESFSLNEGGAYEQVTPLHWMAGVPIDLGLGYRFETFALYCRYRYMIEGRYTNILPMLPTSLVSIGARIALNQK